MNMKSRAPSILMLLENHAYPWDVRVRPHAEALVSKGFQVTVISAKEKGQPWEETIDGVRVLRFPLWYSSTSILGYFYEFAIATLALFFMTIWAMIRYHFDMVVMYNPPDSLFLAAILPRLLGKTIVFDLRDLSPELYQAKFHRKQILFQILLWMEGQACRIADHIIVVNESYKRVIIERHRLPEDKVSVVRQGPDIDKMNPVPPDPELRARAKTIIAYLGNMSAERGIVNLFKALYHLDHDFGHKDWLCLLVGEPVNKSWMDKQSDELGISNRLMYTGYVPLDQWVAYLSNADICVDPGPYNPINNISTTNKMMDYMALSRPVVVFDLEERRVTGADTVLYARANDDADLGRQIARLIENPDLRERLGRLGRKRVENYLALQHQRLLLLQVYRRLTGWHVGEQPAPAQDLEMHETEVPERMP